MFWFGFLLAFVLLVVAIRSPRFREWVASDPWARVNIPSTTDREVIGLAFKTQEIRERFERLKAMSNSTDSRTVIVRSMSTYEACVECVNAGGHVILRDAIGGETELPVIWGTDA